VRIRQRPNTCDAHHPKTVDPAPARSYRKKKKTKHMKPSKNNLRIGIAVAIILGTIGWLASTGYTSSKSYYVTIAELGGLGDKAYKSNLRVEGFVQPGSIEQNGTHVTFVMNEFESHNPKAGAGRLLKVAYKGSEPPPDTFKDDSQALAAGTYGRDGVFHANELQAKCASKYAPGQPNQPAMTPNKTASSTPASTNPAPATAN
jgi:cytochrome c-type biogenesis protein CcmE